MPPSTATSATVEIRRQLLRIQVVIDDLHHVLAAARDLVTRRERIVVTPLFAGPTIQLAKHELSASREPSEEPTLVHFCRTAAQH